jgi:HEAT repeat protein
VAARASASCGTVARAAAWCVAVARAAAWCGVAWCAAAWCLTADSFAQPGEPRFTFVVASAPAAAGSDEAPDDPGYAAYRDGYAKVLNEEWDAARKVFEDLRARYPKSLYADDAQYWSAYALMHTDRAQAIDAYRTFIRKNPQSNYVDDAIVDLAELEPGRLRIVLPPRWVEDAPEAPEAVAEEEFEIRAAMAKQERMMKRQQEELRRFAFIAPNAVLKPRVPRGEPLAPAVQVKIEALHALSVAPDDPASFEKLRGIATDNSQPEPVREVALESAARFRDPKVLPFLVTVAQSDSSPDLQFLAVDLIGEHRTTKSQRVQALIDLFENVPRSRAEQRRAIFYSIADIGNDRAVDFLKTVATTDEDYDLRTEAVFYLGGIGTDHARSALFEILGND